MQPYSPAKSPFRNNLSLQNRAKASFKKSEWHDSSRSASQRFERRLRQLRVIQKMSFRKTDAQAEIAVPSHTISAMALPNRSAVSSFSSLLNKMLNLNTAPIPIKADSTMIIAETENTMFVISIPKSP